MQGILLVDKPAGWTSFDVVNYVRKIVAGEQGTQPKNTKVGHTGTLDPAATGLLVLLVGKEYTRRAAGLAKLDKTYEVTMKLGFTSTTGDSEGEITPFARSRLAKGDLSRGVKGRTVPDTALDRKAVLGALERFRGQISQVPPIYSAIKVNGQRAYKLARSGQTVELKPRDVTVYSSELTGYAYPYVRFTAKVSSGTYIRALVEDLGKELGAGAYMSDLRRTEVGSFDLGQAITPETITRETLQKRLLNQVPKVMRSA